MLPELYESDFETYDGTASSSMRSINGYFDKYIGDDSQQLMSSGKLSTKRWTI